MIRRLFGRWRGDADPGMDCEHVGIVLQHYLDGELDDRTASLVAAHLDACRRCGLEADLYRDLKAAIARRSDPPEDSLTRLREFGHRLSRGPLGSGDPSSHT
jgi:anti-sigma factor RsiW